MRDVVREVFYDFNLPMEGAVNYFYQDVKGLVSIGVGLLCDPIQLAMNLPLVWPDGRPASRNEIAEEWARIKALGSGDIAAGNLAARHGHRYALPYTKLRLTEEGLRGTLAGKLNQMDAYLSKRFPGYEAWPADAQLGTLSLAWACGPAFRFPKLEIALNSRDFRTAAFECFMPEEKTISGLRPRNRVNRMVFTNAAIVTELGLTPEILHWPRDLEKEPLSPADETQPEARVVDFPIVHPSLYPIDDDPDDAA